MIEAGKLSFDSTIGAILDFNLKAIDLNITVEQLLTHTSGIPDYFDERIMENYDELWRDYPNYKIRTSSDLIPLFINMPMMYPRGWKFQYNNTGFVVLGLIIEKVTGMLFDKFLHKEIFLPCGMNDTGYYELDRLPERCANSYIYDNIRDDFYTNIYSVDVKGTGAGGAFTTVWDVYRFWNALYNGKLISDEMTNNMLSLHASDNNEYYGYGIWLDKQYNECSIGNGDFTPHFEGCDPGVSFISSRSINKIVITVVSNMGQNVWKIRNDILKEIEDL
ncbi:Penicillin-binding protein 4* [bioreactor metagenome]|uniref:Penicillin-binding protein 4 n=1 Tax=bioreactor metagenome TaxID=1076179 RepID=A0A645CTZ5_9ZZZZ